MDQPVNLIRTKNLPILEQLKLEEALLRVDNQNYCIMNVGSPPSIVMGISGKVEQLVNLERYNESPIPIIRRYSGGGTVVVDENTLFVSFIFNKSAVEQATYPCQIMKWSEAFYRTIFPNQFSLRENDYVLGDKKFGGNAQSITKNRWVHHSTLLWDYSPEKMELLTLPEKRPSYRDSRHHSDFLTHLLTYYPSIDTVVSEIAAKLSEVFEVKEAFISDYLHLLNKEYRKTTQLIELTKSAERVLCGGHQPDKTGGDVS